MVLILRFYMFYHIILLSTVVMVRSAVLEQTCCKGYESSVSYFKNIHISLFVIIYDVCWFKISF